MRALLVSTWLTGCSSGGIAMDHSNGSSRSGGESAPMSLGASEEDADTGGEVQSGQLTAGEWSDLENWDFWRDLIDDSSQPWGEIETGWGFDTAHRVPVQLNWGQDRAVDVEVRLVDETDTVLWTARTDNKGHAELFAPSGSDLLLRVEVDDGRFLVSEENVAVGSQARIEIEVEEVESPQALLDLMFVIDTTGSMADELTYLEAELADVVQRVKAIGIDLRLSVNFYRDEGDDYEVRSFPFTRNMSQVQSQLSDQSAGGGGDYPEALAAALDDAVNNHQWSENARARLLFPLMDAPPHQTESNIALLQEVTQQAAQDGIRILPIAASGVDASTEFLLRSLDIMTGGTYIFLTNDSGIGNEHLAPTVGDYQVEFLNDLLERIIREAIL
jgi:hypothetical protein